jgi:hypothetical protein
MIRITSRDWLLSLVVVVCVPEVQALMARVHLHRMSQQIDAALADQ